MCINPVLLTERRHQHALFTKSEKLHGQWTPFLEVVPLLLMLSKPGTRCDSLGFSREDSWSDTTPSSHKGMATS